MLNKNYSILEKSDYVEGGARPPTSFSMGELAAYLYQRTLRVPMSCTDPTGCISASTTLILTQMKGDASIGLKLVAFHLTMVSGFSKDIHLIGGEWVNTLKHVSTFVWEVQ